MVQKTCGIGYKNLRKELWWGLKKHRGVGGGGGGGGGTNLQMTSIFSPVTLCFLKRGSVG